MNTDTFVQLTYQRYRGKNTNVPTVGSEKYNLIVATGNQLMRNWARDPSVDWMSRYELRSQGNLSSGLQEYELDDDIIRLSDYVELRNTSNQKRWRSVVKPQDRARVSEGVYTYGRPLVLTFIDTVGESLDGFTLYVGCYTMPDAFSNANDEVLVDNPDWLSYATAAELARNDPARDDQFGNLQGIANDLYAQMKAANDSSPFAQSNGAVYNMPTLGGLN